MSRKLTLPIECTKDTDVRLTSSVSGRWPGLHRPLGIRGREASKHQMDRVRNIFKPQSPQSGLVLKTLTAGSPAPSHPRQEAHLSTHCRTAAAPASPRHVSGANVGNSTVLPDRCAVRTNAVNTVSYCGDMGQIST